MLPERLRLVVDRSGLTRRSLSILAGLDPTHVSRILAGDRPNPGIDTIAAIAKVTGVALDYIVLGKGPEPVAATVLAAVKRAQLATTKTTNPGPLLAPAPKRRTRKTSATRADLPGTKRTRAPDQKRAVGEG